MNGPDDETVRFVVISEHRLGHPRFALDDQGRAWVHLGEGKWMLVADDHDWGGDME